MISTVLLVCSKCNNSLDTCTRLPRLMFGTGDTYCQICVENFIKVECTGEQQTLENFPLNQTLIRILQTSNSSQQKMYSRPTSQREDIYDQSISKLLSDCESGEFFDNLTTSFDEQNKNLQTPQGSQSKVKSSKHSQFQIPLFETSKKNSFICHESQEDDEEDSQVLLRQSVRNNENHFKLKLKPPKNLCRQHKKNADVVCISCKEMICASCALFGNHRGHDISSEEDVLLMLTERANDIMLKVESVQQVLENIISQHKGQKLQNKILEHNKQLVQMIESQFDTIRKMIDKEENKCLEQIQKLLNSDAEITASDSNLCQSQLNFQIKSANDWCLQARHAIETLAEVKSGKYKYWDLLALSNNTDNEGFTQQKDLNKLINNMEDQIQKSTKNTINLNFNINPLIIALEGFCKISRRFSLQSQQNISTSIVDQLLTVDDSINKSLSNDIKDSFNNEMSDILNNDNECVKLVQSQVQHKRQTTPLSTPKTKIPPSLMKSKTPKKSTEPLKSLSPINNSQIQLKQKELKKKNSVVLSPKIQKMIEQYKYGQSQTDQFDASGTEFSSDMAKYFGAELRYLKVKNVKLMKCKMTDDQLETFFDSLGNFNDGLCTINLSQNNLTDKCIDLIKELQQSARMNKNLKNIILSQNKINVRKTQQKVIELKLLGLLITI